jgi:flavorubredoxin
MKISNNAYWVGKVDDRKVPFHRLILERGTTYNSYLLTTEKPTVIDTVDILYAKEYVENLSQIISLDKIEYIVINHVEPDHAGALPALAAKAKNAKIVATRLGAELLKDMFKLHNREFIVVEDQDTLDIGGKVLKFITTPYLHTEETMITYSVDDGVMYPCDIFSTHIATEELMNDLVDEATYLEDFKVYYQLIMAPHRPYVRDMLDKIKSLDINIIAPSHGFILRDKAAQFIELYDEMSRVGERDRKVAIVFSSMTGNTAKIAQRLSEALEELSIAASVFNLKSANIQEVTNQLSEYDGILVGSSTKYGDMVGNTEEFLKSLQEGQYSDKLAAAFGSFGWSGEAVTHVEDYLNKAGFQVINQRYMITSQGIDASIFPLRVRFAREQDLELASKAGRIFGEEILIKKF